MSIHDLRRNWDGLGRVDPLWAVLAYPERHGGRWRGHEEEFFETGRHTVDEVFRTLDRLSLRPHRLDHALDFGSGAGRLSQGLARHVDQVTGVDIAASMIDLATQHNTFPGRVTYQLNESPDLSNFGDGSFDLLLSLIVLQHIPNPLKRCYLTEFVRILRPGGVAVVNIPSHGDLTPEGLIRRTPNSWQNIYRRRRYGYSQVMEFHPLRRAKVEETIEAAGGRVLHAEREFTAGPRYTSYLYIVGKS